MASKTTLNAKNLQALGPKRLAELLLELTKGNTAAKQRLRLELAAKQGGGEVAREVRKRLSQIARARGFVDWQKIGTLVKDLETQRAAIVEQVAKTDPNEALDLLWRFQDLAEGIYERCDDSSGRVGDVFRASLQDFAEIAVKAKPDRETLADRAYDALLGNGYGQYDYLIEVLTAALGDDGLAHLKERFTALANEPKPEVKDKDRRTVGYWAGGASYAHDMEYDHRKRAASMALQDIADAQDDADAYIAQQSEESRSAPAVAANIAARLLKAGRAEDAWQAINAADIDKRHWIPSEWEDTKVAVLEALGRDKQAQEFRWSSFECGLDGAHLKAYLKKLPDFDDMAAEEKAFAFALQFPDMQAALHFFISWPALDKAAELVLARSSELNGDHYALLTPAADALEQKHPLAATLLRRALIDFALGEGRSTRYRHAARHLMDCENMAGSIVDYGDAEPHDSYVARLRAKHGKKTSFWALIE